MNQVNLHTLCTLCIMKTLHRFSKLIFFFFEFHKFKPDAFHWIKCFNRLLYFFVLSLKASEKWFHHCRNHIGLKYLSIKQVKHKPNLLYSFLCRKNWKDRELHGYQYCICGWLCSECLRYFFLLSTLQICASLSYGG